MRGPPTERWLEACRELKALGEVNDKRTRLLSNIVNGTDVESHGGLDTERRALIQLDVQRFGGTYSERLIGNACMPNSQNSGIFGILVPELDSKSFWLKATEEMDC